MSLAKSLLDELKSLLLRFSTDKLALQQQLDGSVLNSQVRNSGIFFCRASIEALSEMRSYFNRLRCEVERAASEVTSGTDLARRIVRECMRRVVH